MKVNIIDGTPDDVVLTLDVDTYGGTGTDVDLISQDSTVIVNGLEPTSTWIYSTDGGSSWSSVQSSAVNSFELLANTTYSANEIQVKTTDSAGNEFTAYMPESYN